MTTTLLATLGPSVLLIFGGFLKVTRQAGRIEEGVKGLYGRVDRLERFIDQNFRWQNGNKIV
jgi:hypothetical protein